MSKPGVLKLSGESFNFVFKNMPVLFAHLKILLPFILVFVLIGQVCKTYDFADVSIYMALPWLLVLGCFTMSWHRTSLMGADAAHAVNPFALRKDEWRYVGLFFLIYGTLAIFINAVDYASRTIFPSYGEDVATIGDVVALLMIAFLIFYFFRLSFLLPAKAQGATLSLKDATRASKGMIWPVFATTLILLVILLIALSVYSAVSLMIVRVATGELAVEPFKVVVVSFVLSIPVVISIFVIMAMFTTALSRAYQWGIQNNPHA